MLQGWRGDFGNYNVELVCDAPEEDLSHVLKCKELINENEECKTFGSEIFFQDVNKLNIEIVKEHLEVVEKFLEEVQKRN